MATNPPSARGSVWRATGRSSDSGLPLHRLPGPAPSGTVDGGHLPLQRRDRPGLAPGSLTVRPYRSANLAYGSVARLMEHGEVTDRQLEALLAAARPGRRGARAAERARGAARGADGDRPRAAEPERVAAGDHLRRARNARPAGSPAPRRLRPARTTSRGGRCRARRSSRAGSRCPRASRSAAVGDDRALPVHRAGRERRDLLAGRRQVDVQLRRCRRRRGGCPRSPATCRRCRSTRPSAAARPGDATPPCPIPSPREHPCALPDRRLA